MGGDFKDYYTIIPTMPRFMDRFSACNLSIAILEPLFLSFTVQVGFYKLIAIARFKLFKVNESAARL